MLSIDCSKFSTLRKSQTNRRNPDEWVFRCPETLQKYVGLQSLDRMDGKPDVELVEPRFQCLLVTDEKVPVFRKILGVHKNSNQFVVVGCACMSPAPM